MEFAIGALTVVILADRAAFWSLLYFGKVRVSSPTAQTTRKRQPKEPQASGVEEQAGAEQRLSVLGGESKGEAA